MNLLIFSHIALAKVCRLYVILELYKLRLTYSGLKSRTKALRSAKPVVTVKEAEGFELQSTSDSTAVQATQPAQAVQGPSPQEQVRSLRKDWEDWKSAVISNAYVHLPLQSCSPEQS